MKPNLLLPILFTLLTLPQLGAQDFEVTVTATRSTKTLLGVPSLTLDKKELQAQPHQNLVEILANLPGVTRGGSQGDELIVSGYGENGHGRLLVILDGAVMNPSEMAALDWSAIPLSQVQSLTLYFGGASALYGQGAVGGVVDIRTGSPAQTGFKLKGLYGSHNSNLQEVSALYFSDFFRLQADFKRDYSHGLRERTEKEILQGALAGFYEGEDWQLSLSTSAGRTTQQLPGSQTWAEIVDSSTKAPNLDDSTVVWTAHTSARFSTQLPGLEILIQPALKGTSTIARTASFGSRSVTDQANLRFPLQLQGTIPLGSNQEFTLTGGADLNGEILNNLRFNQLEASAPDISTQIFTAQPAFWVSPLLALDSLELYGALRVQYWNRQTDSTDGALKGKSQEGWHFPWSAGISYSPLKSLSFNLELSQLLRLPFLDEQISYYGFGTDGFNLNLKPEEGLSGRLGFTYDPLANLKTGGHFLAQWVQGEIAFNNLTFSNENLSDLGRLTALFWASHTQKEFQLKANVQWTHTQFLAGTQAGRQVPLVSPWSGSLEALVFLPFGFEVGNSLTLQSEAFRGGDTANAQAPLPGRAVWDARVSWKNEGWEIFGSLNNVLDYKYAFNAFYSPFNTTGGWYGAPGREFRVGLVWGQP